MAAEASMAETPVLAAQPADSKQDHFDPAAAAALGNKKRSPTDRDDNESKHDSKRSKSEEISGNHLQQNGTTTLDYNTHNGGGCALEDAAVRPLGVVPSSSGNNGKQQQETVVKEEEGEKAALPTATMNGTAAKTKKSMKRRWRAHQMAEDYTDFVGNVMYPGIIMGPYGYNAPHENQYPLERITSLGYLKSPLRRPTVIEKWSPYEIATFEASLFQYGKLFHKIQQEILSKTTKDVVEFYYVWKKTSHYTKWKDEYVPGLGDSSDEEDNDDLKVRRTK